MFSCIGLEIFNFRKNYIKTLNAAWGFFILKSRNKDGFKVFRKHPDCGFTYRVRHSGNFAFNDFPKMFIPRYLNALELYILNRSFNRPRPLIKFVVD